MSVIESIRVEDLLELLGETRDNPVINLRKSEFKSNEEFIKATGLYVRGYEAGLNEMIEIIIEMTYEEEPRGSTS